MVAETADQVRRHDEGLQEQGHRHRTQQPLQADDHEQQRDREQGRPALLARAATHVPTPSRLMVMTAPSVIAA